MKNLLLFITSCMFMGLVTGFKANPAIASTLLRTICSPLELNCGATATGLFRYDADADYYSIFSIFAIGCPADGVTTINKEPPR